MTMMMMTYAEASILADRVIQDLSPHCLRISIAGSVRRKRPECRDIEVVAIPKPYQVGLFESGIATVVNQWPKVKGELPCKYTQRMLPEGIKLDLFFATSLNWGLILAIRTGSAEYSHKVLARGWSNLGYHGEGGMLIGPDGEEVIIAEEQDLFNLLGIDYCPPEQREVL